MSYVFEAPRTGPGDTFAGGVAGFEDLAAAARDQMLYVDNSFATHAAMERAIDERNTEVFAATGFRPENPFRRDFAATMADPANRAATDAGLGRAIAQWQAGIAEAAAKIPDGSVAERLNRSIEADAIRIAREADHRLAALMETSPGLAKYLPVVAGGAWGALHDPVTVTSLFIGGGPGAGRTVVQRLLTAAAREAFVNAGTEAAMQPLVQAWREKAGLDHGLSVALTNIGFAAAFGGVFGAGGQAAAEIGTKLSGRALAAAADAAAVDGRVAPDMRAALSGDTAAARQLLEEIRPALPAAARGALDHAETLDHLEAVRPAAALPERHELAVTAAHRTLDAGPGEEIAGVLSRADPLQVERVTRAILGEELQPALDRAVSLVDFLKARGGVLDDRGELAALGAGDLARSTARRGRKDRRVPLDAAREAAEEAGYIGRAGETGTTSVADLLDAIDREMRGQKVYARADIERAPDLGADAGRMAKRAELERTVAEIAGHAGPAVDDRILREAAELAIADGMEPFDALESVLTRMDDAAPAKAGSRTGDAMPGWSDAELERVSAERGDEPFADPSSPFDDPSAADEAFALSPAEAKLYGDVLMPGEDGRPVTLAAYMEQLGEDDELLAVVKACKA